MRFFPEGCVERLAEYQNVFVTQMPVVAPVRLRFGRTLNKAAQKRHVLAALEGLGIHWPLLWLGTREAYFLAGSLGERGVVYDFAEERPSERDAPEAERERCAKIQTSLMATANLVVAGSMWQANELCGRCREVLYLPDGLELGPYQERYDEQERMRWRKPVFGFAGELDSVRLNESLIVRLAEEFPRGSVVLVAKNKPEAGMHGRLRRIPNVYLPSAVSESEIPRGIREFDVCIAPYRMTGLTGDLRPLELWDYFASGKPIVSSRVPEAKDYEDVCYLASDPEAFVRACRSALAMGCKDVSLQWKAACENSWQARVEILLKKLQREQLVFPAAASPGGMAEKPVLSVVVVSQYAREVVAACLRSLREALEGIPAETILVEHLPEGAGSPVELSEFPEVALYPVKRGLGNGYLANIGMEMANGDFFLLLDGRVRLAADAVHRLLWFVLDRPRLGIAGLQIVNDDGSRQASSFDFPSPFKVWWQNLGFGRRTWRDISRESAQVQGYLSGACLLVRREVVERVGGFDPQFPVFGGEIDWQARIRNGGWDVGFVPEELVTQAPAIDGEVAATLDWNPEVFADVDRYYLKHFGVLRWLSMRAATIAGSGLRAVLWKAAELVPALQERAVRRARCYATLFRRQCTARP